MISKKYISIFLVFLSLVSFDAISQTKSRSDLEKQKRKNQARIARAEDFLKTTRSKKKNTIGAVKTLNHKIQSQESQVNLIEEDLKLIDDEIAQIEIARTELSDKLTRVKKEYGDMLYLASKSSGKLNKLSFIFASQSFNELLMRYKYIEQYTESRKLQVKQISTITENLEARQKELSLKKGEKKVVLDTKQAENTKLLGLKQEQTKIINELSKEEKKLRKEIDDGKRSIAKLDNLISAAISKGRAKTSSSTSAASSATTAGSTALSSSFKNNRNKLPWPVSSGIISDKFGVKNHPVLKGIKIDNHGVDIQTSPNATVSSVFDGTVLDISQIPGLNNVVAIQHGDYYTIYANLSSVSVKINQTVTARQTIGVAGVKDGEYEINFQVWYKFDKQNPEIWLFNK